MSWFGHVTDAFGQLSFLRDFVQVRSALTCVSLMEVLGW